MAKPRQAKGIYRKPNGIYFLRTDPITKDKKSTHCYDLAGAIEFREHRRRIASGIATPEPPSATATLGEWLGRYWATKKQGPSSEANLRFIESKLGHVRRLLGDDRKLATIKPSTFDWYVSSRRGERGRNKAGIEQRVSDRTIVRELRELLSVLRLAKRAECFEGDLQALLPTDLDTTYHPGERALTEAEIVPFLDALPTPAWRAYACLCIGLGCRQSEACRLRPEDVEIRIVRNAQGEEVEEILVWIDGRKTRGSNRVIPVLSPFVPLLRVALPELPIGPISNFDRTFKLACERAGIAPCCSNDLRRTNATLAGSRGLPNELIAKLLGHETVTMSQRVYNRAQAVQLRPVAERILSQADPLELPGELRPIERKAPGRQRERDAVH